MDYRSNSLHRGMAILVLAVNLLVLGACASSNGSMAPTAPTGVSRNATSAGCTQYSVGVYCKVDDPSCPSSCENEITGINVSRDIVGNWSQCTTGSGGSCSSKDWSCNVTSGCEPCPLVGGAAEWNSYTSVYGNSSSSYSTFFSVQYPDAPNYQYMYAISDESVGTSGSPIRLTAGPTPPPTIEVGCINTFSGASGDENGVWANVDNKGLWSQHDKPGESQGCDNKPIFDSSSELLGYDSTNHQTMTAVGFYTDYDSGNACHFRVWKVKAGGSYSTIPVHFPMSSSNFTPINIMASGVTGTNGSAGGEIVGTATGVNSSDLPVQLGWLMTSAYSSSSPVATYQCSGAAPTAFTGIAEVGVTLEIVGWCTQGSATHGLVARYLGSGTFSAYTIDEPNAQGLTVINGINSRGDICGWYTDQNGKYHGFVGLGIIPDLRARPHRHLKTKHAASLSHDRYEI